LKRNNARGLHNELESRSDDGGFNVWFDGYLNYHNGKAPTIVPIPSSALLPSPQSRDMNHSYHSSVSRLALADRAAQIAASSTPPIKRQERCIVVPPGSKAEIAAVSSGYLFQRVTVRLRSDGSTVAVLAGRGDGISMNGYPAHACRGNVVTCGPFGKEELLVVTYEYSMDGRAFAPARVQPKLTQTTARAVPQGANQRMINNAPTRPHPSQYLNRDWNDSIIIP